MNTSSMNVLSYSSGINGRMLLILIEKTTPIRMNTTIHMKRIAEKLLTGLGKSFGNCNTTPMLALEN